MRTEEIRLSFHGLRVRFRVFSPDEEPVAHRALFVSSPAGDVENWEALAGMLTECGCLCVTAELPGFGKSPCGTDVPQDNDTRARILWGILDEVEVRRGEEKYIFPYQEGADATFNSTLVYEVCMLKRHAYDALCAIPEDSPNYAPAHNLVKYLKYVVSSDAEDEIPLNSILREFVGGSCFEK